MSEDNTAPAPGSIEALLARARSRVNTWEASRQAAAEYDDIGTGDVRRERIKAQSEVMKVIEALRPYLVGDVPASYWRQAPENHPEDPAQWLYYDQEQSEGLAGLAHVMSYRGRVITRERTEKKHDGYQTVTEQEAMLIPRDALRNALAMVSQASYELGFIEAPNSRRRAYDAGISADTAPPQPATGGAEQAATDGGEPEPDV